MELTKKQTKLLEYVTNFQKQTGQTPSLRQCASDLGVTHGAIAQLLNALEKKGVIKRDGRYGRQISVLSPDETPEPDTPFRRIPLIGSIAAGLPLYAQQEWDGTVVVDPGMYKGEHLFALRTTGDSMKNAAILHGDILICEPRQFAKDGEIIVALINHEEATVKRFYRREDHIELKPENSDYKAVQYKFSEILVQGKVIGVIRGPDVAAKA